MSITQNVQNFGSLSPISKAGADKFPNPFFDIASEYFPDNIKEIFELAEYLYLTFGTYRSAARRVVRYFLTRLVLTGEDLGERDEYEEYLTRKLKIMTIMAEIGDDYMTYGNSFVSVYFPFDRFLICPECGMEYHIDTLAYKFKDLKFIAKCRDEDCGYSGEFARSDRKSMDRDRLAIKRWNPKRIQIRQHPVSGETEYYYELEQDFVEKLRDGNSFYIRSTPWEVLECVVAKNKTEAVLFKFNKDSIFHLHEATLAGLESIKAWGIPPIIPNFKLAYYIQVLRRYDEALAFDFIVPQRIIFPVSSSSPMGMDALQSVSMSMLNSHIQDMIKRHREDPTTIQAMPFPIGYQMIGGEGQQLAPKESIAQALDELLNAVGFPADLYRGSLQLQVAPVALRLFEKTWNTWVTGCNDILNWMVRRIAHYFGWGEIGAELQSVTLADDLERKALQLQAAAGMDISKDTAYSPFGIDYLDEQHKILDEQQKLQQLQMEAQEEANALEMQQSAGGGQGGGGPMQEAGVGATPGDVAEQGKQIAEQMLLQVPDSMRRGELIKIKHTNPTLHAIVLQEMNNMRYEMSRQGQHAMLSQAREQAAAGVKQASSVNIDTMDLGLEILSQICEYTRDDLKKIAMDVKHNVRGAKEAFSFIYSHLGGR